MLFDTHAHLNDAKFDADRERVIDSLKAFGVERVVEIADAPADWDKAIALSRARPDLIRCSLGLHPYYADQYQERLSDDLLRKSRLHEVRAIGEIGLDYAKCAVPRKVQKESFQRMLEIAWSCRLPVVIHCREAYEDMMPLLEMFYRGREPQGRFHGVLHCFSGTSDDALRAVALRFALGVDGPVTYPKNDGLRAALKSAGIENLVLETDSPYLPPQSARGRRNDPSLLPEIARAVGALFGGTIEDAAAATSRAARDLYHL